MVRLIETGQTERSVGIYLNRYVPLASMHSNNDTLVCRLSDFLFTAARYAASCQGEPDVIYRKALGGVVRDGGNDDGASGNGGNDDGGDVSKV